MHTTQSARRSRGPARFFSAVSVAVILALTLGACQGIPTKGGVHQGLSDLSQAQQQVQYRPDLPMPEASEEEIVRGFLQAASSPTDDYAIARQFLTRDYEKQWNPTYSVFVDEGTRYYEHVDDTTSRMKLSGIAWIDERGILTPIEPGHTTEVLFELQNEDGQWRISAAPDGVILDRTTFLDVWSQHQLYFGTVSDSLLADSRWFLNRATMSTHIIGQLLEGPAPRLGGVATSAFVPGTELASDSVFLDAGTARIDLTEGFDSLSPAALTLAEKQIGTSLNSVPGVTSFVVTIDQVEVMSGPVTAPQSVEVPETVETNFQAGLMQAGEFGYLRGGSFQTPAELRGILTDLAVTAITMDSSQQNMAVLTPGGVWWLSQGERYSIDERRGLLAPSIDRHGYVWTVSRADPSIITVQRPGDAAHLIEVPWLAGREVVAMRVSPTGSAIAVLTYDDLNPVVYISGITRETMGLPNGVVDPAGQVAFWLHGEPLDLDWVDAARVVALSKTEQSATKLTVGGLGMFAEERAGATGATSIRGGGRSSHIQLLSDSGDLWSPQGTTGWQRQATDIDLLSKRG